MIRDPSHINKQLIQKDKVIYAAKELYIEFPKRYEQRELVEQGQEIAVYGVFAIIDPEVEKYSVSLIPAFIKTEPLNVREIEREGTTFIQFQYAKDVPIVASTTVTRNKITSYDLFEEFYLDGKAPWYMEYKDMYKLLSNLKRYADSNIGANTLSNELITSYITRNEEDPTIYYRQATNKPYTFVALENVFYSTVGTLNKISGAYFTDGLVASLVNKEDKPTDIENIVRA